VKPNRIRGNDSMAITETKCAYCGDDEGPFQDEHIIPRCLWDSKRPSHMITVPACGPCNQDYGKDEEYFRTALVAMADEGQHPELEKLLTGKVKRGLDRNSRLRADLTRGFGLRTRVTPSGLFAGWGWSFTLDLARFSRGVEKTVRGLFAYKSGRRLAPQCAVRVFPGNGFWQDTGFQNLLAVMEEWAGVGDEVFQCRSMRDATDPDVTAWLFIYYRALGVFAWTERVSKNIQT
jgi:hypothetical protein